jgi:DNA-binding HxlR family transcriptional regulator
MIEQPKTDPETEAFQYHLKVFGDAWMLIIMSELLGGSRRFNDLQRRVCGISPVTLTNRLKKLESLGLITRSTKTEDQLSVSYCVTSKGHDMQPVLQAIRLYGQAHFDQPADCDDAHQRANQKSQD